MTFTPNWKVDDKIHGGLETKGGQRNQKIIRCRNGSRLQFGVDKDLLNKGLLGCNTSKHCHSVS